MISKTLRQMLKADLLVLLLAVVSSQQQSLTVEHNSQSVPNHSLLFLMEIGDQPPSNSSSSSSSSPLRCQTTQPDCCLPGGAGSEGSGWSLPSGLPVQNLSSTPPDLALFQEPLAGGVDLFRRESGSSPEGIYGCQIPGVTEVFYVGLYMLGNGELGGGREGEEEEEGEEWEREYGYAGKMRAELRIVLWQSWSCKSGFCL